MVSSGTLSLTMTPRIAVLSVSLLAALSLAPGAPAQIAAGDIIVAHTAKSSTDGLMVVTLAGKATKITGHSNGTHVTVALDRHDPKSVWGSGSGPTVGKLSPVNHYTLKGTVASKGSGDGTVGVGNFGKVVRAHVYGNSTLLTLSGSNAGLYRRPNKGGNALLIWKIPDAFDIAVIREKAYVTTVSTATPKAPSKLFEVDLVAIPIKVREIKLTTDPTQTTPPPKFFGATASDSVDAFSSLLCLMDDKGRVHFVDPNSPFAINTLPLPGGLTIPVIAVARHHDPKVGWVFATKRKLYDFNNYTGRGALGTPFYTSSTDIHDIDVGNGGMSLYGQACAGARGKPTWFFGGYPFQGNKAHQLRMVNGPKDAPYHMVIGVVPVPQSLARIGAPNCFLNLVILVHLGGKLNGSGQVRVPAPIPVQASLQGVTAYVQFGIADPTANAAGLITSRALKLTIR